jgi:WD40 repeat protein
MLTLTGHSGQVTALAFSSDGRWLATAGWDGSVRLWERPNYRLARYLRTPYDHALAVAFSPNARHVAIGFRNRDYSRDFQGYGNFAWTTTVSQPGTDPDTLPIQDTWNASEWATTHLAVHPLRDVVTTVGEGRIVAVWDAPERKRLTVLRDSRHELPVMDISYTPDGTTLAAITMTHRVYYTAGLMLWNEGVARPIEHIAVDSPNDEARALAPSPDGRHYYIGYYSGRLNWWRSDGQGRPGSVTAAGCAINDLAFAPDGRSLLLAGEDGQLRLWDVNSRHVRATYDWRIGTVRCVAVAPDGLTAAAGGDGVVLVWDLDA